MENNTGFKLDKTLGIWHIVSFMPIGFGYIYNIAVFQTSVEDYQETNDKIIEDIKNDITFLKTEEREINQSLIKLTSELKYIREELSDINIKIDKLSIK